MNYLYLLPIVIALLIGASTLFTSRAVEKKMIDRPFMNEISNQLYVMSYFAPFKWFINANENSEKVKNINRMIIDANETKRLNYRVYTVIQILTFIFALILFGFFALLTNHSAILIKYLFNIQIDVSEAQGIMKFKVIVGMLLLVLCLVPSYYLKSLAKKNKYIFLKDLPILQLFIILMLKAKRPLMEVLFVLSTTNTIYKSIFETAYRISVRDKDEGMNYLLTAFENTKFEETIKVLKDYNEYSKQESMHVLENGFKNITEYTNTLKRRKDIGKNAISQISLAIPFLSAILFIFAPLVYYGLTLLNF